MKSGLDPNSLNMAPFITGLLKPVPDGASAGATQGTAKQHPARGGQHQGQRGGGSQGQRGGGAQHQGQPG
jgi:hypothetical protein